jgi:hypothetical protein
MNYVKSIIAYLHESQVVKKGRSDGEAKIIVSLFFAIITFFYLFFVFMLLCIFKNNTTSMEWFLVFGKSKISIKIIIYFSLFILTGLIFIVAQSKFYNRILNEYYSLTYEKQKSTDKKGEIGTIALFVLPIIGIICCLLNLD